MTLYFLYPIAFAILESAQSMESTSSTIVRSHANSQLAMLLSSSEPYKHSSSRNIPTSGDVTLASSTSLSVAETSPIRWDRIPATCISGTFPMRRDISPLRSPLLTPSGPRNNLTSQSSTESEIEEPGALNLSLSAKKYLH